jgi:hypothetical protein
MLVCLLAGWREPGTVTASPLVPLTPREAAAKQALQQLMQAELKDMVADRPQALARLFLPDSAQADAALKQAVARAAYLKAWASQRRLVWQSVELSLRTPRVRFAGQDTVTFYAVAREAYRYRYAGQPADDTFGIGVRHYWLVMRLQGDRWYIAADDFINPAAAERLPPGPAVAGDPAPPPSAGAARAVAYADRYCGAAPGCGNDGRYNPAFRNYNGDGGDCTNFISQALQAGGLPETADWAYDAGAAEGTRSWSNADGLAAYLDASGRAVRFAEGPYRRMVTSVGHAPPPVRRLRPGDLISYQSHGRWVHTAIVVGYDSHGVPLTDAHSNDRYHVPWDFGWDSTTRFTFWHVRYPAAPAPTPASGPPHLAGPLPHAACGGGFVGP